MRPRVQVLLSLLTVLQLFAAVVSAQQAIRVAQVTPPPSAAEIGMQYDINYLKEKVAEIDHLNLPGVIARFEVYERSQQTTYTLIWGAFITGAGQLLFSLASAARKRT